MVIRIAEISDLEVIDEIYNQAIETKMATADTVPYSQSEREDWFAEHPPEQFPVFVAEEIENVIGYFSFSPYRKRRVALNSAAEISYFVHKDHLGRGLGSRLMEFGLAVAKDYNLKYLVAILLANNEASIGLLHKYGFREWGRLPGIAEFGEDRIDHLYYGINMEREKI